MNTFDDLKAVGFEVTMEQVVNTVRHPDHVDRTTDPPIAQKRIDAPFASSSFRRRGQRDPHRDVLSIPESPI